MVKSMEKSQEFCMKPVHAEAYMLDPKYEKNILSVEEINMTLLLLPCLTIWVLMKANFSAVWQSTVPSKAFGKGIRYGNRASTYLYLTGGKDFVDLRPLHFFLRVRVGRLSFYSNQREIKSVYYIQHLCFCVA